MGLTGRVLGIDYGERRVGIACSDSARVLASPHAILERADDESLLEQIATLLERLGASEIVIGLPLSLSGAAGPAAQRVSAFADLLEERLLVPVHRYDERLSSSQVSRLRPRDARSRARPRAAGPIDDLAASVILQAYLDERRVT